MTTTEESIQAFKFPRPESPVKDSLKPNAHPYPIRTTSTGILTRSNSSPRHQAHHSNHGHHYVPSSSPSPTNRNRAFQPSRHRYSRSMSSDDNPRPLPIPPSMEKGQEIPVAAPTPRRAKRDALPTPPPTSDHASSFSFEDLPANPKSWTPSQLSAYLAKVLRVKSGEALQLPAPVVKDIAAFVRDTRISGRAFLRFDEADFERLGLNKLWRTTLLAAARSLRQNILKGQIWGIDADDVEELQSPAPVVEFEDNEDTPNRRRQPSISESYNTNPFVNGTAFYSSASSSSSVEDLSRSAESSPVQSRFSRFQGGKVHGMVQSFERSSSVDEGDPTRSHLRARSRDSGMESSEEDDMANSTLRRPLPIVPAFPSPFSKPSDGPEPTIEELLASTPSKYPLHAPRKNGSIRKSSSRRKRGVNAWEDIDGVVTMKRVASPTREDHSPVRERSAPSPPFADIFSHVDVGVSAEAEPVAFVLALNPHAETEALEQRLQEEVTSTRALMAQLQNRLLDVEQKIAEMEAKQLEREKSAAVAQNKAIEPTTPPTTAVEATSSLCGRILASLQGSGDRRRASLSAYDRLLDPKSITQLPSYVLLVSLGMCAVVLRVVMRRTLGAAARPS